MKILQYIAGFLLFFGGSAAYGLFAKNAAISAYNLQPAEKVHYDICVADMKEHNLEYEGGASNYSGCACATKLLLSELDEKDMTPIWDFNALDSRHSVISIQRGYDPASHETEFKALTKTHKLSKPKAEELYGTMSAAFAMCEQKAFHSKETIAQIATLTPKSLTGPIASKTEQSKLRGLSKG